MLISFVGPLVALLMLGGTGNSFEDSVGFDCNNLEYNLLEGYVEDDFDCNTFRKAGLEDSGLFYYFSTYNPESLNGYDVEYENEEVKIYDFVDYGSLEGHVFGEVNFRVCDHLSSDYFLIEADTVVDEDLELDVDVENHMGLDDFVIVCSSLKL